MHDRVVVVVVVDCARQFHRESNGQITQSWSLGVFDEDQSVDEPLEGRPYHSHYFKARRACRAGIAVCFFSLWHAWCAGWFPTFGMLDDCSCMGQDRVVKSVMRREPADPRRCSSFAVTAKGPALLRFNRSKNHSCARTL